MTQPTPNERHQNQDKPSGIFAFYAQDHAEIDVLFAALRAGTRTAILAAAGTPALSALFDAFDARLERHIRWEEEILFPAVEQKEQALADGPGRVMRLEHEEIRRLKAIAGEILRSSSPQPGALAEAAALLERMFEVLVDHNGKEEQIYYPMSDQILDPGEREELLARTRACP